MRRDHYREPSVFAHLVQAEFPRNPMKRCASLVHPPYDWPSADRLHQRGGGPEGCPTSPPSSARPLGRCGSHRPRRIGGSGHQRGRDPHGVQRAAAARRISPVRSKTGPRARCLSCGLGPRSRRGPHANLRPKWDLGVLLEQPMGVLGHPPHPGGWHRTSRTSHPRRHCG